MDEILRGLSLIEATPGRPQVDEAYVTTTVAGTTFIFRGNGRRLWDVATVYGQEARVSLFPCSDGERQRMLENSSLDYTYIRES